MLSKAIIKLVSSLEQKKYRLENNLFVAEGNKIAEEIIKTNFPIKFLIATSEWLSKNSLNKNIEIYEVEENEIKKISFQKTPQSVIAVCNIIENKLDISEIEQNLTLALDNVQDPGNVGTIIRIADWFGIKNILASYSTADVYNPKVIQATMGAFARMKVHYILLPELLRKLKNNNNLIIYGTTLNGKNIYEQKLESKGIIVMGSEGNGISKPVLEILSEQLLIPNFSNNLQKSESLNVATATAIVCSEFRRQQK